MLEKDIPLIENIDAALRYLRAVSEQLKTVKNLDVPKELALWAIWGIRHAERTAADALTRALRCIALDVDKSVPKQFEALLQQFMVAGGNRPAFLTSQTQQYLLLARNVSLAAGLPIMPVDIDAEWEAQRKSALAMVRVLGYLIKELENMREWCMANLDPQESLDS